MLEIGDRLRIEDYVRNYFTFSCPDLVSCQVVWITPTDDPFFAATAATSPFRIADELRAITGEVDAAKPTHTGSPKVKAASTEEANQLAQITTFLGSGGSHDVHHQPAGHGGGSGLCAVIGHRLRSQRRILSGKILSERKDQSLIRVLYLCSKNRRPSMALPF